MTGRKSNNQELIDLPDAARRIARHPSYLRRLVHRREITYYKIGGRLRFDLDDLDQLLASCRVEARWTP